MKTACLFASGLFLIAAAGAAGYLAGRRGEQLGREAQRPRQTGALDRSQVGEHDGQARTSEARVPAGDPAPRERPLPVVAQKTPRASAPPKVQGSPFLALWVGGMSEQMKENTRRRFEQWADQLHLSEEQYRAAENLAMIMESEARSEGDRGRLKFGSLRGRFESLLTADQQAAFNRLCDEMRQELQQVSEDQLKSESEKSPLSPLQEEVARAIVQEDLRVNQPLREAAAEMMEPPSREKELQDYRNVVVSISTMTHGLSMDELEAYRKEPRMALKRIPRRSVVWPSQGD